MSTVEPPGGERDRDATEIDASFAAIVAGWGSDEPVWPEDHTIDETAVVETEVGEAAGDEPAANDVPFAIAGDSTEDALEDWEDEGHYDPPEPPPFPRPRASTLGAMILLFVGLVLLFAPGLIGLTDIVGLPVGLLAEATAIFWLFLLLRTGPPVDSGWDDGSRI